MKQEEQKEKVTRCADSNNEEELLDINELMDVQGGVQEDPLTNCGLGCYLSGINNTGQGSDTFDENDKS